MKPRSRRVFALWERLLIGALTLAAIMAAAYISYHAWLDKARQELISQTELAQQDLGRWFADGESVLVSLSGLAQGSDDISSTELASISQALLDQYPHIYSLARLVRVTAADRSGFEREMHQHGYTNFFIRQSLPAPGRFVRAGSREEYFVLTFVEPWNPYSARYVGVDLLSMPGVAAALTRAVVHGGVDGVYTESLLRPGRYYLLSKITYYGHFAPQDTESRRAQASGGFTALIDLDQLAVDLGEKYPGIEFQFVTAELASSPSQTGMTLRRVGWLSTLFEQSTDLPVPGGRLGVTFTASISPAGEPASVLNHAIWPLLLAMLSVAVIFAIRNRRLMRIGQRQAEEALARERERAQVTLRSIGDAVITIDDQCCVQYMNRVAEALVGVRADYARGCHLSDIINPVDEDDGHSIALARETCVYELLNHDRFLLTKPSGELACVDCTVTQLDDHGDSSVGRVLVLRDISRERELAKQLTFQATHDRLTGLANRWEFEAHIAALLEDKDGREHALCYLDLDQFKLVNDTCGHVAGDKLLRRVSQLLTAEVRDDDLVARVGGDEFAIILANSSVEAARRFAERVRSLLRESHFEWDGKVFDIAASIGVVPLRQDDMTPTEVQSMADLACYTAKDRGRDCVHVYEPGDQAIAQKRGEMDWHNRIKAALKENRLCLYWQDIYRVSNTGSGPCMREFLVRMRAPNGDLVPPMAFIPAAERFGLISAVDRWVIENAIRVMASIRPRGRGPHFTINLSAQSLQDEKLARHIDRLLNEANVPPAWVCFEITETAVISNLAAAGSFIQELKNLGCKFALDDFGTGVSSFGHLKRLPVDYIKIDGEFVRDITDDPVDLTVVESIAGIGKALGIPTVAERVENAATFMLLKQIKVDYVQGTYFGEPKPVWPLPIAVERVANA